MGNDHMDRWQHLLNLNVDIPYDSELSLIGIDARRKMCLGSLRHSLYAQAERCRKNISLHSVYPSAEQTSIAVQLRWKPKGSVNVTQFVYMETEQDPKHLRTEIDCGIDCSTLLVIELQKMS